MAGIIKDGKQYGGCVTDEHIKEVIQADLDKKIDKTSIAKSLSSSSTNEQVAGANAAYAIKTTADRANELIVNHLSTSYKIVGVTFSRNAISQGGYVLTEISYTVPDGYYILNFQVAHNGHFGIYIFTQYLSSITGNMKFTLGFANATTSNIEAQTDLVLNVYLAKV